MFQDLVKSKFGSGLGGAQQQADLARPNLVLLLGFMLVYYDLLITNGTFHLFKPLPLGLTFNSMLFHLLQGQFDVDPASIGYEAFLRDGKTYSYFGIFPALIRLPLLPFLDLRQTDVTELSLLVAVCLGGFFKLRALLLIQEHSPAVPLRSAIFWALTLSVLLGGPQVQFLKSSIYQESASWAGSIAAMFNYYAIRGLVADRRFSAPLLARMAAIAGCALLTRPTFGVGLYAALGLLMMVTVWSAVDETGQSGASRYAARLAVVARQLLTARFLAPSALLLLFAAACGIVNYGRWGNPFVFADFNYYALSYTRFTDRLPRLAQYGEFNVGRIWYGLMYYFMPIWVIFRPDGQFLFHEFEQRMLDGAELPPSTFFLTDPLLIFLGVQFFRSLRGAARLGIIDLRQTLALLAAEALPFLLMLSYVYMAFRYRMEFFPFLELSAFLGFYLLCAEQPSPKRERTLKRLIWEGAIIGIVFSHAILVFYKLAGFGPATHMD